MAREVMIGHLFGVLNWRDNEYVAFEHIEQSCFWAARHRNMLSCYEAVLERYNEPGFHVVHLGSGEVDEARKMTKTICGSYPGVPIKGLWNYESQA